MSGRVSVRDDGWRLPDELWAKMEPLLPPRPRHPLGCHNPRVPDRKAMDAIFFVLRTGCQWNALNATGICSSSSAHRRFLEWTQAGVFAEFWRQGLLAYDAMAGIDWNWLALDGANRHDMRLVRQTIQSIPVERPEPSKRKPQGMCMDKGYDYPEVRQLVAAFGFTAHIRSRGEEAKAIKRKAGFKARRWVCERSHSWFNRFRRILIRWEKKPENYIGLLHLVCAIIAFRCAGLFG